MYGGEVLGNIRWDVETVAYANLSGSRRGNRF